MSTVEKIPRFIVSDKELDKLRMVSLDMSVLQNFTEKDVVDSCNPLEVIENYFATQDVQPLEYDPELSTDFDNQDKEEHRKLIYKNLKFNSNKDNILTLFKNNHYTLGFPVSWGYPKLELNLNEILSKLNSTRLSPVESNIVLSQDTEQILNESLKLMPY